MTAADYPSASPHDSIEEVFRDVFFVRGSMPMNALMSIGRNMVVVRDGAELTVLNSVRLTPPGEAELEALGTVRHVVRLGYFHGRDDRYYVDRYGAEFWAPEGSRRQPGPAVGRALAAGPGLPFPGGGHYSGRTRCTRRPQSCSSVKAAF